MISIKRVVSSREISHFIHVPKYIYKTHTHWIPPLWHEERRAYTAKTNPILAASEYDLFVVYKNGIPRGRVLAYMDHSFNNYYGGNTGFFGAFETVDDPAVYGLLFETLEEWLLSRGADRVRGPINPVAEHWGFLFKGYEDDPVFLSPYNPAYYNTAASEAGYLKVKDLLAFSADTGKGYRIPPRFDDFRKKFLQRNRGFSLRRFNKADLAGDAEIIWNLSNASLKDNWGYVPVDRWVMEDMIDRLKVILDDDAVWFVEDEGVPVGFCLGFPDFNVILKQIKGRLFPFGFLKLVTGLKKISKYRLFGLGILPEYHGRGLDALLYTQLQTALAPREIQLEANYILEDNYAIRNALEKMGLGHTKTYRVYEKALESL